MKSYRYGFFGLLIVSFAMVLFMLTQNLYGSEVLCKPELTAKIDACLNSDSPRTITDYVCIPSDNREKVTYQIILDEKFKVIDEKINTYLGNLERNKSKYFGPDKSANHIDGINEIVGTLSPNNSLYLSEYMDACGIDIIREAIACSSNQATNIDQAQDYFDNSESVCVQLAVTKLAIAQEVAFNILNLNKHTVRNDTFQLRVQSQRTQYDTLLEGMMINQGYMVDILQKIPNINKKTY